MTTQTATAINEVLSLIANHPAGYLILVKPEMFAGSYNRTYPGKLSVEGDSWVFSTSTSKTMRSIEEVKAFLDLLIPQSSASGWARRILEQNSFHTDTHLSTRGEDESRFLSAEKLFFLKSYEPGFREFIVGDFKISYEFGVTSFQAHVAVRGTFCPEAAGQKNDSHFRNDDWLGIGVSSWSENGSGFNRKYKEAILFLQRFIAGDWEGVTPYFQDNRSSSINARTGESSTRFWSAQLTFPEKAHGKATFPLFVSRLMFPTV